MNEKTIALLATVGSALIYGAVEAVKSTGRIDLHYLPFVGAFVGILVGLFSSLAVGDNVIYGAMLGAVTGLAATGIHEAKKNTQDILSKPESEE